jgi:hypothetical protein
VFATADDEVVLITLSPWAFSGHIQKNDTEKLTHNKAFRNM